MNFTQEEILALQSAPPLTHVTINGRDYPVGTLTPEQQADIGAWGMRRIAHDKTGAPLERGDEDLSRSLQWLLHAGDPSFVALGELAPHVTGEHIRLAGKEVLRQAVVAALAPSKFAGQA